MIVMMRKDAGKNNCTELGSISLRSIESYTLNWSLFCGVGRKNTAVEAWEQYYAAVVALSTESNTSLRENALVLVSPAKPRSTLKFSSFPSKTHI